jgi:predicted PurR-regulated permease PerM
MRLKEYLETAQTALGSWLLAQTLDSVGILWLVGLLVFHVPFAPLWAILAAFLQYIPHFGPILALIGPAVTAAVSGGFTRLFLVLVLYAAIAMIEGFVIQPFFMKRTARVPIWASITFPILLGLVFSFWGVLLAAPLLAIIYAFRRPRETQKKND